MAEDDDFPDPPVPPVGEGEGNDNFFVDMRGGGPADDTVDAFPEIQLPIESMLEGLTVNPDTHSFEGFTPHRDEAMGFPLMKACIMDDINGETEFSTQIGRIYWRKEGPQPNADGSASCDPCKAQEEIEPDVFIPVTTAMIGVDCFAPKSHSH